MDRDELVQYITGEVMRQIRQAEAASKEKTGQHYTVLAVFTGGTIGLEPSLTQLQRIQELNTQITVVLSKAAEAIVGVKKIRERLGDQIGIVTAQDAYPGKLLRQADAVVVPVLTQNTAAKVAYTLSDSMVPTLILQALMLGKPVIAAENAADPQDDWRIKGGMAGSAPALMQALQANLQKIESYGVRLVQADRLAAEVEKVLGCATKVPPRDVTAIPAKKKVLDAAAIKSAALSGAKMFKVAQGTIITPLARDIARECNIELVYEADGRLETAADK